MTHYPERIEVKCPVCITTIVIHEVEEFHSHQVQCPFCKTFSYLERFEISSDPLGKDPIDVLWVLIKPNMVSPN